MDNQFVKGKEVSEGREYRFPAVLKENMSAAMSWLNHLSNEDVITQVHENNDNKDYCYASLSVNNCSRNERMERKC